MEKLLQILKTVSLDGIFEMTYNNYVTEWREHYKNNVKKKMLKLTGKKGNVQIAHSFNICI